MVKKFSKKKDRDGGTAQNHGSEGGGGFFFFLIFIGVHQVYRSGTKVHCHERDFFISSIFFFLAVNLNLIQTQPTNNASKKMWFCLTPSLVNSCGECSGVWYPKS